MIVCGTTACFPGMSFSAAVQRLLDGVHEPLYGAVSMAHCQLCPQSRGALSVETLDQLCALAPATQFRLHANVRLGPQLVLFDASTQDPLSWRYFERVAALSRYIGASVYSLHAGRRSNASLPDMRAFVHRLADLFGHIVAVEGLYPTADNTWLISDWQEYQWLLESDLFYALDLSHLAIVASRCRSRQDALLSELLLSDRCVEIHLSDNDGYRDTHYPMTTPPWWWQAFQDAVPRLSARTVVFTEGNQCSRRHLTRAGGASDPPRGDTVRRHA